MELGLHDIVILLIVSAFGFGFRCLVVASPLGVLPYKPFDCDTCLSGWGSILGAAIVFGILAKVDHPDEFVPEWSDLLYFLHAVAGTGVARLSIGIARMDRITASEYPDHMVPELTPAP